jgi:hypothetical protein
MNNLPFRDKASVPAREYEGRELRNYRDYKSHLRRDFKNKCGYTNCLDDWFGGVHAFQIDHFLPHSKYPELKNKYSNLIYCCSYVNRAKSNDEGNYLDPCDEDYNEHFYRNGQGKILPIPSSSKAVYMHKRLKLYLKRYSIIWILEQLEQKMETLRGLVENIDDNEVNKLFIDITMKYMDYKKYLRAQ